MITRLSFNSCWIRFVIFSTSYCILSHLLRFLMFTKHSWPKYRIHLAFGITGSL